MDTFYYAETNAGESYGLSGALFVFSRRGRPLDYEE